MKWTVIWLQEVEQELAELWLASADRAAISDSANQIDSLLRTNPEECGKVYESDFRLLVCPPLAVAYSIDEPNRIVRVLGLQAFHA